MFEEKSISEICKDLLVLVRTFQKAYRESTLELQESSEKEEEKEQKENHLKGEEKAILQEEKEQMEQRKLMENTPEGNSETQQIDNCITFVDDLTRGKGDKKKKARVIGPGKRDRSWKYQNQWKKKGESRSPIEEIKKLAEGKRRRRERGKEGSYKNRRKKGKEKLKLRDWNLKENG